MSLQAFDDFINRIGGGFYANMTFFGESFVSPGITPYRMGDCGPMPSLPAGVTAYIPTAFTFECRGAGSMLLGKTISLATYDSGGSGTGTFTGGSAMPSQTVLGSASTVLSSALLIEYTSAVTGPVALTITYTNQSGTGSQTTTYTPTITGTSRGCGMVILGGTDWGVQAVTACTRASGAGPTGTFKFWGIVPITISNGISGQIIADNFVTAGVNIQRLGAGDSLGCFDFGGAAINAIYGSVYVVDDN